MGTNKLLISEPPLQVLPSLAVAIGLDEAIILQQLHYWLSNPKVGKVINGKKWVYNSYTEWRDNFPFWSESTIQRAFLNLVKLGLVITEQLNKQNYDRTNYYRIDYDKLEELANESIRPRQNDVIVNSEMTPSTTSKTTSKTTSNIEGEKPVQEPEPRKPRTAEDLKASVLKALEEGQAEHAMKSAKGQYGVNHFPPEVQATIEIVCDRWKIFPPYNRKASDYKFWIASAKDLKNACGEFGLALLDEVYEAWKEKGFFVSSPSSLVKVTTAVAGRKRVMAGDLPPAVDPAISYAWNSELSEEENLRLMHETMKRVAERKGGQDGE